MFRRCCQGSSTQCVIVSAVCGGMGDGESPHRNPRDLVIGNVSFCTERERKKLSYIIKVDCLIGLVAGLGLGLCRGTLDCVMLMCLVDTVLLEVVLVVLFYSPRFTSCSINLPVSDRSCCFDVLIRLVGHPGNRPLFPFVLCVSACALSNAHAMRTLYFRRFSPLRDVI